MIGVLDLEGHPFVRMLNQELGKAVVAAQSDLIRSASSDDLSQIRRAAGIVDGLTLAIRVVDRIFSDARADKERANQGRSGN